MAGLERLRLSLLWANAAGLLPFRMELEGSGRFRRFRFSYGHPSTWWCAASALLQVALADSGVRLMAEAYPRSGFNRAGSAMVTAMQSISVLLMIVPHVVVCRWRALAEAADSVGRFDAEIGASALAPCTSRRRTAVGLALAVFSVASLVLQMTLGARQDGRVTCWTVPGLVFLSLASIKVTHILVLYHVSFYNIGHRMDALVSLLGPRSFHAGPNQRVVAERPISAEDIERARRLYCHLWRAAEALGSSFSVFILVTVVTLLIAAVTNMFMAIEKMLVATQSPDVVEIPFFEICGTVVILHLLHFVLTSSDLPARQVKELKHQLAVLSARTWNRDDLMLVTSFAELVSEQHLRCSVGHMFQVGAHLAPGLIGAIITYLVILLQWSRA